MVKENKQGFILDSAEDEAVKFEFYSTWRTEDKYLASRPYFENMFSGEVSNLISRNLYSLIPTTNMNTIAKRQNTIKVFIDDFERDKQLLRPLQIYSAASNISKSNRKVIDPDLNLILNRLYNETINFFELLNISSPDIAKTYSANISHETIHNVFKAYKKGGYDRIIVDFTPSKDRDYFSMQGVFLEDLIAYDLLQTKGISPLPDINQENFIKSQMYSELEDLSKLLNPFITLYAEAINYVDRKNKQKPVCIPNMNNKGSFSMKNGEPLDVLVTDAVGTNIELNENSSSVVFNGLHSGGKTIMLRTILRYFIDGLSGFTLHAEEADIPVVKKIKQSFKIERTYGGKLQSEMRERYEDIKNADKNTLLVYDEFLQHASPDAAEYLEPVLLNELKKTKALIALVTHRGYNIGRGWQVFNPQYEESEQGLIVPKYTFAKGKPDEAILKKHALQILEQALLSEPEKKEERNTMNMYELRERDKYAKEKLKEFYSFFTEGKNYEN